VWSAGGSGARLQRLRRSRRQYHRELAAAAEFRARLDASPERGDHPLDQGEAESPTPGVCLWRTGSSCVKGSKMSRWRSAGMPGPESMTASPVHPQVVRHRYLDAALLRVLDAVADEVGPRAREILAEAPQRAQVLAPDPRAALHLGRAMLAS